MNWQRRRTQVFVNVAERFIKPIIPVSPAAARTKCVPTMPPVQFLLPRLPQALDIDIGTFPLPARLPWVSSSAGVGPA